MRAARVLVVEEIRQLLAEDGLSVEHIKDEDDFANLGLDSLSFAVLLTRLEDALGFDPFELVPEDAFPPRSIGQLIEACATPGQSASNQVERVASTSTASVPSTLRDQAGHEE